MYLLDIAYTAPADRIETVRPAHRAWLAELLERGLVLVGGPAADHRGGIVVLLHASRTELDADLAHDPYLASGLATHRVDEFAATMRLAVLEQLSTQ